MGGKEEREGGRYPGHLVNRDQPFSRMGSSKAQIAHRPLGYKTCERDIELPNTSVGPSHEKLVFVDIRFRFSIFYLPMVYSLSMVSRISSFFTFDRGSSQNCNPIPRIRTDLRTGWFGKIIVVQVVDINIFVDIWTTEEIDL